jgi:hypothetical protein
MSFRV